AYDKDPYPMNPPRTERDSKLRGVFAYLTATRPSDVVDGTSETALYAEARRGTAHSHDSTSVLRFLPYEWGLSHPPTNPRNFWPCPRTDWGLLPDSVTGLRYYDGSFASSLYTHTAVPNHDGRDCLSDWGDLSVEGHIASRSYHLGGVNTAFVD